MFNATQTYKDLLIKRLEEQRDDDNYLYINGKDALTDAIRIIRENDIPPVMQEPHKIKQVPK